LCLCGEFFLSCYPTQGCSTLRNGQGFKQVIDARQSGAAAVLAGDCSPGVIDANRFKRFSSPHGIQSDIVAKLRISGSFAARVGFFAQISPSVSLLSGSLNRIRLEIFDT
jgi:hypothetical protein